MQRCLELAKRGTGYVAPNPMVGAVLVYQDRIIGEGWHRQFGEAHAEVNCINHAIQNGQKDFFPEATLYVSLEPCAHYGKTPPCTDLIIKNKIPKVVIGVRDPFEAVNGRGIEKLVAAGVEVVTGIVEEECKDLNKRFFTFHTRYRPYVILKWAQTGDGFMGTSPQTPLQKRGALDPAVQRLLISNEYSNKLVHQWRSEEAAILVGTNTALLDDPELTTRLWPGNSPVRLVVDMELKLPASLKIFNRRVRTIVFNANKQAEEGNLQYYRVSKDISLIRQILNALYELKLQSLIVEGGAKLLQSFIDKGLWDEARVINNEELIINDGLPAPVLLNVKKVSEQKILNDKIETFRQTGTER
jgi:diaminohydroxyphosphoribosylaminopyrimidine deaminase/5-amino-6-(5-phosphoribosylamino)uracil reductase